MYNCITCDLKFEGMQYFTQNLHNTFLIILIYANVEKRYATEQ